MRTLCRAVIAIVWSIYVIGSIVDDMMDWANGDLSFVDMLSGVAYHAICFALAAGAGILE